MCKSLSSMIQFMGICAAICSCQSAPYQFGRFQGDKPDPSAQVAFDYGRPQPVLDRMAWFAGIPSRIIAFRQEVNSHSLSSETADAVSTYLQANDLTDVLVRVNQYDPAGEWRRLNANSRIGRGWRHTVGVVTLVGYTLFPGRVFGGDHYNPFTNTLNVNSDVPALLLVESAYAKDIHSRRWPGTYAAINELPLLSLWRFGRGVDDAIGYARLNDDWETERETYRTVFPLIGVQAAMGGHTIASALTAMPLMVMPLSVLGGAATGHACGQISIAQRRNHSQAEATVNQATKTSPEGCQFERE